jgi:aryl-alcohol dehydrogenase-like predicted oxidoreductase
MAKLVDDGLVQAIGVSNFDRTLIEQCEAIRHVDSLQPHVSMLVRDNLDLVRWCGQNDIGVVAYSPLGCGLLTGAITRDTAFEETDWRGGKRGFTMYDELFGPNLEGNLATVERLRPIAKRLGIPMADLAIAWVLDQPGITAAIVGSRNPKHVAGNVEATNVVLGDATRQEIEDALKG